MMACVDASCNFKLTSNSGSFHSPNYPNNYASGKCEYKITVPKGKAVQLTWKTFNVGPSKVNKKCPGDTVSVYDGTKDKNNGIDILCGQEIQSITSSGGNLTIILDSKSDKKYKGFSASYTTIDVACNGMTLSTDSGYIASPNYPNPYPINSNCLYKIQLPPRKVIAIGWLGFDIPFGQPSNCQDYVEVYDKEPTESSKVYRYCDPGYYPPQFTSSSNVAYIKFVSSSTKNKNHKGFIAYYRSGTRQTCNINYGTATGVVTVPNVPSLVGQNLDCKININAKLSDIINFKWMEFGSDLFSKPDSCQNFIEIYGGDMTASNLVSKKCNSKTGSSVSMNGTTAIVHYKIKNYNTKKNFRLVYQGVTTGVLHKEIIFKNATCEAIEWYYNTPFGKVISRTSFSCSSAT
ncbi:uncharacterized protein TRIADDRAFT_61597 [Trichoplax adhaerens]|uniref:CUB domain-containing protein n=1 Tax=Trichoplax adhaerens TaxID=10228 RepID=B3SBF5_TRIAD|nr:hypothetical protein TRIADDRAFT_61597 [Trichoplax adhaerens]EDV19947.1 hypothetical protein TRIADDRAFT_61597 [Trichoplax adhaerens]|eukprot:XP_002117537.1 hypothetical protein TRIADDRAFT_61597 [Trichoplax adhaerens]